jgi:diacylglycerol kinase family enzyme
VEAYLDADVDLLVIVGGDGTVQGVLCHLFATQPPSRWPLLTVVPGGTTNMTALDLGILGDPESVLQKLRNCLLKQATPVLLQRHVLRIQQAGAEAIYGMFFAVGLIARAVIFSQSRIKKLGITGEIYSGIITLGYLAGVLFGFRKGAWAPVKMSIMEDNVEMQRGAFAFLFASTLDRLLFGMRPYWGQEQEPLHVTFVGQQRKHPLRSLLQLLSGKGDVLKEKNGYHSRNTQVLELLVDDVYIVDGESYRAAGGDGPLRITAAGPVSFMAP